jgi:NADH dehydrogenase
VIIGSRRPTRVSQRLPRQAAGCERRLIRFEHLLTASAWKSTLVGIDTVLNCVGILRSRPGESYDCVHHQAVAALADACIECGIRRLVHVSALGLHPHAASGFLRSKWHGEQALRQRSLDVVIARPSLLDGADGFGARWLRRVSAWPVHFVPSSATGTIAPLDVDDLAEALCGLCELEASIGVREFELGGADRRSLGAHLASLRPRHRPPARVVLIPNWVARSVSHVCDLFHLTPFSFGHLELLAGNNVPAKNALPTLIRRAPRWIGDKRTAADFEPKAVATT